jgi:asparagine synthase (glutamine-hydrolysing)
MCGIAGIVDLKVVPGRAPDEGMLKRMTDAIAHRGPDAGSFHFEPGVAFGHRRLSIIDVASGHQPMSNEDDSVWVVFNGEIYNFEEVRTRLVALGHTFKTNSDTEIILHGWEAWGVDCLEHFRGMFAFCLWDRNQRKVFIARDRLGVKPLYYSLLADGHLLFGSELKAISCHPKLDRTIDPHAVEDYLAFGYVPEPKSIYAKVKKLPAAHYVLIQAGTGALPEPLRYWSPGFGEELRMPEAAAIEQLDELLQESIRLRLISEVPLGAFLSGGLDSSLVVATMARVSAAQVKTCSIGFNNAAFDESAQARLVAKQYNTDHAEYFVGGTDISLADKLIDLYDEPFADASALPTYRVCELARQRVTVALSGDGGDETFAGYRRYRMHMGEEMVRQRLPLGVRRAVFGPLGEVYPKLANAPQWLRAKSTFQSLGRSTVEAYFHSVTITNQVILEQLKTSSFKAQLNGYHAMEVMKQAAKGGPDDPVAMVQHIDYQTYLPGDINVKVDRASMAHSLEVREPLMDHKLVEWAARLNRSMHIEPASGKKLLKTIARKHLPSEIIDRPKQGFIVPINEWLRGEERHRLLPKTDRSRVYDFVDRDVLASLVDAHVRGAQDHSRCLWSIGLLSAFFESQ